MIAAILHAGAAALVCLTALERLRTLRFRSGDVIQRANCLTLCALALALTIMLPPVYRGVDHLSGQANAAKLCADLLSIYGLWAFQPIVEQLIAAHLISGRSAHLMRVRRKILASHWLLFGVAATLVALFWLAPVHDTETPSFTGFVERFGAVPFVAEYTLIMMLYLTAQTYDLFLLANEGARILPIGNLRLRARLQALGWLGILALFEHECVYVLLRRSGERYPFADAGLVRNCLLAVGVTLLMSGGFLDIYQWWRHYRDCRALFDLWRRVTLEPRRPALLDALLMNRISLRRYDRAMEIWDGLVALQPYTEHAVIDLARALCQECGVAADEAEAIVEAAGLASALAARRRDRLAWQPLTAPLRNQGLTEDLDGAIAYLRRVAQNLERSPLVLSIARSAQGPGDPRGNHSAT